MATKPSATSGMNLGGMRSSAARVKWSIVALIALPALAFALAYLSYALFDRVGAIGPLDKAKLAWLVTFPLILIAPGLAAGALNGVPPRTGLIALATVAVALAISISWLLVSSATRIGCQPIERPWDAIPAATFVGVVAGLSFIGASLAAARVAMRFGAGRTYWALGAGAIFGLLGSAATLFSLSQIAFPAVSCAPPI
jgi:hypothetical protein